MPRTKISTLTVPDLIIAKGALGLNTKGLAAALELSSPTITGYERGNPISERVAKRLNSLLATHYEWLRRQPGVVLKRPMDVEDMLVQQNLLSGGALPPKPSLRGRLYHRQDFYDAVPYPTYCLTPRRARLYVQALALWKKQLLTLQCQHADPRCQLDYKIDHERVRKLALMCPRQAPYNVTILRGDWPTVSSALQHLATYPEYRKGAQALYWHWRRHRFAGYQGFDSTRYYTVSKGTPDLF